MRPAWRVQFPALQGGMPETPRLSVAMCVRNEAARLPGCLEGAAFADEIVVLLDRSEDASAAIARGAGAKVIEGAWEIEGERRNAAIAAASGDWVLELDADEEIGPVLADEIRRAIAAPSADVYVIPFDNRIGGRSVKYGWGAYNGVSAKACLFRKGAKVWGRGRVHPEIKFTGTRAQLTTPIVHHVYPDISALIAKLNRYSDLAAQDLAERGDAGSRGHAVRRVFSRFYKAYVARRGYREGYYGLALGLMAGLFPLLSHLKAQELLKQ
jgi:glycosyltransferase involved in cell wall biosynthesis